MSQWLCSDPVFLKRLSIMALGCFIMGIGVTAFKLSLTGNDPCSGFAMALADVIALPFSVTLIGLNTVFFIFEYLFDRRKVGIGTFFNWFGVGIFTDLWYYLARSADLVPQTFTLQLVFMMTGVIVLSFSCALYQTANMGIAPYDALSLIMTERLHIPYFWCRITTDAACALLAFLLGGIVGLGTLFCAFGMGPFVSYFTKNVIKKYLL